MESRDERGPLKISGGPGYFHPCVEPRARGFRGHLGVESGSQDMTYDARRMLGEPTLRYQRQSSEPDERREA